MPSLHEAQAGRRERHGGQQRADEGHEHGAREAQIHVSRSRGRGPRSRAAGPRSSRSAIVSDAEKRQAAQADRAEDALLEALVQLRRRAAAAAGRAMTRRPKLRITTRATIRPHDHDDAQGEDDLDRLRQRRSRLPRKRQ